MRVWQSEQSYINVHCTMQHVNRSNASNVNNTATLRLTVLIPLLAVNTLQVTRQKIVRNRAQKNTYLAQDHTKHRTPDARIKRNS